MAAMSFAAIASKEPKQRAPLQRVQLEGHVVLKIAKHCKESDASLRDSEATVTGQLLGLDVGPTLEVTDCFPYPVGCGPPATSCAATSVDSSLPTAPLQQQPFAAVIDAFTAHMQGTVVL